MNSSICTLFEGHYHYGVASLSNSLYKNGFRGTIYAGYRGELPPWALKGIKVTIDKWDDAIILNPLEDIKLVFLKLNTNYSLANYKPDFMIELWEGPAKDSEALFYFDSDILINKNWIYFEQWVNCGVALCEDVNSPLQEFHPRRVGWRNYFKEYGLNLYFKNSIYVNGGFIGLNKKDFSFLNLWVRIQESMSDSIGGLENSIFSKRISKSTIIKSEGFQIFDKTDQDALNATIELYSSDISYFNKKAGMGFGSLDPIMFHALGMKPWKINHLFSTIIGNVVRPFDILFWENSNFPIKTYSTLQINIKIFFIYIAKLINRFYKY